MTFLGSKPAQLPDFSVFCDDSARGAAVLHLQENTDRFELLKGVASEAQAVRFSAPRGRRWPDVVATDAVVLYLISSRFRTALVDAGASGWHGRTVKVNGVEDEHYEMLVVTGHCGAVNDEKSEPESRLNRRGVKYKVWTGLYFDPTTWDGTDVFCPADSGLIFMTRRACDAIQRAKLENVRLAPGRTFERLAL